MIVTSEGARKGRFRYRRTYGVFSVIELFDVVTGGEQGFADFERAIRRDRVDAELDHIEGDARLVDGPDDAAELLGGQSRDERRRDGEAGVDASQSVLLHERDQVVFDVRFRDGAKAGAFVVEHLPV